MSGREIFWVQTEKGERGLSIKLLEYRDVRWLLRKYPWDGLVRMSSEDADAWQAFFNRLDGKMEHLLLLAEKKAPPMEHMNDARLYMESKLEAARLEAWKLRVETLEDKVRSLERILKEFSEYEEIVRRLK